MYQVSDSCKQALARPVHTHALRGSCSGRSFTGSLDVVKDSFKLNKQMCDATEVRLGGVYVGQLQLTFTSHFASVRGDWLDKVITPELGIKVDEDFEWIPCPSGSFIIKDAVWTAEGLEITAYDNMSKFDRNINLSASSGFAYDFLNAACIQCGVNLGMTRDEVETFINGTELLGLYPTESIVTWRDMLGWLAQTLCAFATIDRNGALILVKFPDADSSRTSIDMNHRYSGASFSDFDSYFTEIRIENIEEGSVDEYSIGSNKGLSMNLGANPFLQYGTDDTKDRMRRGILFGLFRFRFAPFSASVLLNPTFDLGDNIEFVGGIAQGCIGTVMSLTFTLDTTSLSGFGDNPALQDVMSKTDKEMNGVAGAQSMNKIAYFTYSNVSDLVVGNTPQVITDVRFVTTVESTVVLWAEVDADYLMSASTAKVTFTYYVDDEEVTYHPIHTVGENGKHLIGLNYYLLNLEPDMIHRFVISMSVAGATANIPIDNIHFCLSGQGLVKENSWDGRIEVNDTMELHLFGSTSTAFVDAGVSVNVKAPVVNSFADVFGVGLAGGLAIGYRDVNNIILEEPTYRIATSDGDLLVTTDDYYMGT